MVDILSGGKFDINQSNQTWDLLESSVINTPTSGIYESSAYSNNTINVYGDIYAPMSFSAYGVLAQGTGTTVNIMSSSYINADQGVVVTSSGVHITNYGTIDTRASGFWTLGTDTVMQNYGKIFTSGTDITMYGGTTTNDTTGLIVGSIGFVSFADTGQTSTLYNYGSITGATTSFQGGSGNDTLVNKGTMSGNVILNRGNDTYYSIGGTLANGTVDGGLGNDTYNIDQANIVLLENPSKGGVDQVNATFSYTLGGYFENLTLTGTATTGTGNTLANIIKGNGSDNTLYGMDGNDTMIGAAGSDLLYGGSGTDVFVYAASNDIDTVRDFANGTDRIDVKGFSGISSFNDLKYNHVVASGANLIISSSYGQLIIENMTLAQLDATDFIF